VIRLLITADGASTTAFERQLERFGCRVVDRTNSGLWVEFPSALSEREAAAEARLYLALWRSGRPSGLPSLDAA
jgi:hypothetical protein